MRKHFSEYFRPTDAEKAAIWAEAIFVFDTNMLLNLYRLSRERSVGIIGILKKLKGRLFLPHQVGVEFYRHREEEIAKQINAFEFVRNCLEKIPGNFKEQFSRHPCIPIADIANALASCVADQMKKVTESQAANQLNFLAYDDPILAELDFVFTDCSEGPYTDAEDDALNQSVEARVQQNLPPCCILGAKTLPPPASNPHRGDGRVWFQIVKHAEEKKKPIVFVTADEKTNWWRTARLGNKERTIGPHFMLIRDLESVSGKGLLMYTQEQFLSEAPKYLAVPEQAKAIEEVKQIQESGQIEKDTGEGGLWYCFGDLPESGQIEKDRSASDEPKIGAQEKDSPGQEKDIGSIDQPKTNPFDEPKGHAEEESE